MPLLLVAMPMPLLLWWVACEQNHQSRDVSAGCPMRLFDVFEGRKASAPN